MTSPTCDFFCDKILKRLPYVPVYFENERVFAFHHTNITFTPVRAGKE
jgi:histidine triad (HIT) family protein